MSEPGIRRIEQLRRVLSNVGAEGAVRVAVITPYCSETPEYLGKCLQSVALQTHPCTHFLIGDCPVEPIKTIADSNTQHILLPTRHVDWGDTPRAIGSLSAVAQGFDAITYLDADNWYDSDHVECMLALQTATNADVCVAARSLHRADGSLLSAKGEARDGIDMADTNCLFLMASAYRVIPLWGLMPKPLHAVGDRVIWEAMRAQKLRIARWKEPTVRYRTSFRVHYEDCGETPPDDAKSNDAVRGALAWWRNLKTSDRELVWARLGFRM